MKFDKQFLIEKLNEPSVQEIELTLPGDLRNRPKSRPSDLPGDGSIGAVLLLVYEKEHHSQPYLVLTKRHSAMNHHAGQISLPGGRNEPGESLQQTAIREAAEEIGIDAHRIQILSQLSHVYIPPSDFTIYPFVAWYAGRAEFTKSEQEVEEIIEVSVEHLCQPESMRRGTIASPRTFDQRPIESSFFDVRGHQVWGATAIVLNEFIQRLEKGS